ncbi:MAG: hypothetical protein GF317_05680 [Candidatus Lokiarchaeota archaeon]|nr:hypothetical protein [Candidatus Lokiarchaeota archaeon]MBD3199298.1 hypothetical protein [Candidatus Lokiarchaeota archaeon]
MQKQLKCTKCGKLIETIPQHCEKDMIYNEETNQLECHMGPECGYISLDEYVCQNCCEEV